MLIDELYPSTFRISPEAAKHIAAVLRQVTNDNAVCIPELGVAFKDHYASETAFVVLGFRERSEVPEGHIQIVDGVELSANLHEKEKKYFENATLHCVDDKLALER